MDRDIALDIATSCAGKQRHPNKRAALRAVSQQGLTGLCAYPCPVCGGWHVGNGNRYIRTLRHRKKLDRQWRYKKWSETDAK